MEFDVFIEDCPARTTLELIAHRWSVVVLHGLGERPMRFVALQRRIGGIGPKALSDTLGRLHDGGLVAHEADNYSLTPLGQNLEPVVRALAAWAEAHADEIVDAQQLR